MSAFIVSEKTMHRAVEAMTDRLATSEERTEIGRKLYMLNQQAVMARYGDKAKDDAGDLPTNYQWRPALASNMQQYKSLSCLLYQCSEGKIPETSILYKAMEDKRISMAISFVQNMPAFDQADWD